jgi:hypothetical protein
MVNRLLGVQNGVHGIMLSRVSGPVDMCITLQLIALC